MDKDGRGRADRRTERRSDGRRRTEKDGRTDGRNGRRKRGRGERERREGEEKERGAILRGQGEAKEGTRGTGERGEGKQGEEEEEGPLHLKSRSEETEEALSRSKESVALLGEWSGLQRWRWTGEGRGLDRLLYGTKFEIETQNRSCFSDA